MATRIYSLWWVLVKIQIYQLISCAYGIMNKVFLWRKLNFTIQLLSWKWLASGSLYKINWWFIVSIWLRNLAWNTHSQKFRLESVKEDLSMQLWIKTWVWPWLLQIMRSQVVPKCSMFLSTAWKRSGPSKYSTIS